MNNLYYTNGFPKLGHFYKGPTTERSLQLTDFPTDIKDQRLPPIKLQPIHKISTQLEAGTDDSRNELAARIIALNRSKLPAINTQISNDEYSQNQDTPKEIEEEKKVEKSFSRNKRILCIVGIVSVIMILIVVVIVVVVIVQRSKSTATLVSNQLYTLKATLTGHNGYIYRLVQLNSDTIASCSNDNLIKLWNIKNLTELYTLSGHTGYVLTLIKLANGNLASGSGDKTIKIWNPVTKKILLSLDGHTSWIEALVELKDGKLASGSHDKTIKIWDLNTGVSNITLAHKDGILSAVQLQSGKLGSASSDYRLTMWDLDKNVSKIYELDGLILTIVKLKSGDLLLGFYDGKIQIWSEQVNSVIASFVQSGSNNGPVWSLVEMSDGNFAAGHDDGTVKVWDLAGRKLIGSFNAHMGNVLSIIQAENTGDLVTSSNDKTIKFWFR